MDESRQHDLKMLRHDYERTTDPAKRKLIREAGDKICHEDRPMRSMREALIREHKAGRLDNVKDIHESIKGDKKYEHPKSGY